MSIIKEMEALLEDIEPAAMVEYEETLGQLYAYCETTGIALEAEDADELVAEVDEWIANSDLTEDEKAQLSEFAAGLKKFVRGAAHAAGHVAGTAHRAADAYRGAKKAVHNFKVSVKKAYNSGEREGHHTQPAPRHPHPMAAKKPMGAKPPVKSAGKPAAKKPAGGGFKVKRKKKSARSLGLPSTKRSR